MVTFDQVWTPKSKLVIIVGAFIFGNVVMLSSVPAAAGAPAIGILTGMAAGELLINSSESSDRPTIQPSDVTVGEKETMLPYEEWPDTCHACGDPIDSDIRSQYVVHRSEGTNDMRAIGFCEECTWTGSTLVSKMDAIGDLFDHRESPEEI